MDLALNLAGDGPRGASLVEALREAIVSARLTAGARLPPTRLLAAQLNVSRGTVVAAYEELVSEGYCGARVGAGTFVTFDSARQPAPAAPRRVRLSAWGARLALVPPMSEEDACFDFRPGVTPESFPAQALTRALRRATEGLSQVRGTGDPAGNRHLREELVAHLGGTRGLRASADEVIIVSGSQQGLDLAARLLLDPGERIVTEEPGYVRARAAFEALGAAVYPVPVDAGGLCTAHLPPDGARMVYVTPSHQFPTGSVLTPERRLALLEWAERHDAWVLEDDYDSEFRYGGPPLPCLQGMDRGGRCLYLGSLSKLLHPALRVGYLVVPRALMPAALAAKSMLDQATTTVIQAALAELFAAGEIERHLRRAMRAYRGRRAHLLAALARWPLPGAHVWPVTGGLHTCIEIPDLPGAVLLRHARARDLALVDGTDAYVTPPRGTTLVLWFSRIPTEQIEPGIAALQQAVLAARAECGTR